MTLEIKKKGWGEVNRFVENKNTYCFLTQFNSSKHNFVSLFNNKFGSLNIFSNKKIFISNFWNFLFHAIKIYYPCISPSHCQKCSNPLSWKTPPAANIYLKR